MARTTTKSSRKGLTQQTMVGFFWTISGTGASAVLQFLIVAILSRSLTKEDFGLFGLANVVISFAELFYQFGLGPSLIQRKALTQAHIRSAFTLTLLLGATLSVTIWLLAPYFSIFFNNAEGLVGVMRGLSLLFIINATGLVARALNHRNLNFRIKSIFNVSSYVISYGIIGVTLALTGFGTWALVWASLSQSILINILYLRASPHDMRPQLDRTALGDLLSFGSGLTLGQTFNRIASNADTIVVGKTLGTATLGIYSKAFQLLMLPSKYLGNILDSVLFTAMSKVQDEPATLRAVYRRGTTVIALLVTPLSVFLFIFAPEVITVLFGKGWEATIVPFQILAVTMSFRLSYRMSDMVARAVGTVFKRAFRQFIFAVLVVAGAWFGHYWGITGVAVGVSAAAIANFFLMAQMSLKITEMSWPELFKLYLPTTFLSLIILTESWGLAVLLRSLPLIPFADLVVAAAAVGLSGVALIWSAPKTFLGEDGTWIAGILAGFLPNRFKRHFQRRLARLPS